MTEVLFKTEHGSRLYNLHHPWSDHDWYTVVSHNPTNRKRYARQTIVRYHGHGEVDDETTDSFVVDIGTWLQMVSIGVPQACEALMSRRAVVDKISSLRSDYVLTPSVSERYLRTMKSFAMSDTLKSRRHGVRLAFNLRSILHTGRFDPSLTDEEVRLCNWYAERFPGHPETLYEVLRDVALG